MMWEIAAPVFTIIAAIVAIYVRWKRWRESQLRLNEVLSWSNEVIHELQTLVLLCQLSETDLDPAWAKERLQTALFNSSILIERGRLFFKNRGNHGQSKWSAYRGNRPKILDPIVTAHQIAFCMRSGVDNDRRRRMWSVAEDCRKEFVSLAQKEVGRARTVSVDTSRPGNAIRIQELLDAVTPAQLAELKPVA
jgi:hypothetical protein